jgi:hypothetical protein
MKHATARTLSRLEHVLVEVRHIEALRERRPGICYLKAGAFLHFREDPAGLFADLKLDGKSFARFPVDRPEQQRRLVCRARQAAGSA